MPNILKRLADKHSKDIPVVTQAGLETSFKLLNQTYVGIRRLHTDQLGVATVDSGLESGDILTMPSGEFLLISMVTTDYHRGLPIRLVLDLIEPNNKVTITREEILHSPQGGILGASSTVLHTSVPVKVGTIKVSKDRTNDSVVSQFGMLLSSKFSIQREDRISFDSLYEEAKAEAIQLNLEGVFEVIFDKDPRWT